MELVPFSDREAMSRFGADMIYHIIADGVSAGKRVNIGLATGNTMIRLYELLAETLNRNQIDLSRLHTYNLDEYADANGNPVPPEHPLSYRKYMRENLFHRFLPERGFSDSHAHFPGTEKTALYDTEIEVSGGLDLQLLGIGFNGHIAFNEPMSEKEISVKEYGNLPTRLLKLDECTIRQNTALTAGGDRSLLPLYALTMGMPPILMAKRQLLLACFAKQQTPLSRMLTDRRKTPELPASYLLDCPNVTLGYTTDVISL